MIRTIIQLYFLPFLQKNSSSASLPASVGENELTGKKFKMAFSDYSMAYEFTDSTFKYVFEAEFSSDTYNSAYTLLQESTCSYSYNATTKRLYYRKTGYNSYVGRGDKKTALFDSSYSTDAQFVELFKKNDRIIYDNAGDNLDSLRCRIISLGN